MATTRILLAIFVSISLSVVGSASVMMLPAAFCCCLCPSFIFSFIFGLVCAAR